MSKHYDQNGHLIENYHVCGCQPTGGLDLARLARALEASGVSYEQPPEQDAARVAAEYGRLSEHDAALPPRVAEPELDVERLAQLWREEEVTNLDIDCPRVDYEATASAVVARLADTEPPKPDSFAARYGLPHPVDSLPWPPDTGEPAPSQEETKPA